MKKAWEKIYDQTVDVGRHEDTVTITSNWDSDVLIHHYRIGGDDWITIHVDHDVDDDWNGSEEEHLSSVNLNGNALRKLRDKLNEILD